MASREQMKHRAEVRKLEAERDKVRAQKDALMERAKQVRESLRVMRARKVR